MKINSNTIVIIIVSLVVAAGAYWYFFTGTGNDVPLTTDTSGTPAQMQFQTLLSELQPISFDTSIFADVRFKALVDLHTVVAPESSGRLDPFAPVTSISGK
jgi:hypothetical protein